MAWHEITRSCGHVEDIRIYGKRDEQEYKAKKYEGSECRDCWVKARNDAVNTLATSRVDLSTLPPLTGTPAQVRYATKVRVECVAALAAVATDVPFPRRRDPAKDLRKRLEGQKPRTRDMVVETIFDAILTNPRSQWWLDNQDSIGTAGLAAVQGRDRTLLTLALGGGL